MGTFLRTMLTASDNQSYDIGRALMALLVLAFVAHSAYALVALHQPWDPVAWATAAGGLLVAGSGGLLIKHKTEPGL